MLLAKKKSLKNLGILLKDQKLSNDRETEHTELLCRAMMFDHLAFQVPQCAFTC